LFEIESYEEHEKPEIYRDEPVIILLERAEVDHRGPRVLGQ
jgi:hypothetical protein